MSAPNIYRIHFVRFDINFFDYTYTLFILLNAAKIVILQKLVLFVVTV